MNDDLLGFSDEIDGDYDEDMDDLLGGYGEEIVGGRGKRLRRVRNQQLRRYPLGLGATSIAAAATAIITANPQLPFRVNRLVIAGGVGLLIDNLQVGTVSQFVAAGSMPVEVFAPDAVAVQLKGDTAVPGVNVQITVSNPTGGPIVFAGAIIGLVAQ